MPNILASIFGFAAEYAVKWESESAECIRWPICQLLVNIYTPYRIKLKLSFRAAKKFI
jgi:hypothetical protein